MSTFQLWFVTALVGLQTLVAFWKIITGKTIEDRIAGVLATGIIGTALAFCIGGLK
jgi:multisubunit Na+/H+ antiporter MnhF subunit